MTTTTATHAFEIAGLGLAPFRFVGYERIVFQAVPGDPNCPIQPGTCCDYCFQGISNVYWIRSADGKRFKVGCDCVAKTGDNGLRRSVDAKARAVAREASHARQDARIDRALASLDAARDRLAAMPHPKSYMAAQGRTALEYVEWMLSNAGRKGKCEAAKFIERALA